MQFDLIDNKCIIFVSKLNLSPLLIKIVHALIFVSLFV